MAVSDRMNDMLERYGEVCPQIKAAQILSVSPRTIMRMADDGRLRRVGSHIDVRSICHYIENDQEMNFRARYRKRYPALKDDSTLANGEFLPLRWEKGVDKACFSGRFP